MKKLLSIVLVVIFTIQLFSIPAFATIEDEIQNSALKSTASISVPAAKRENIKEEVINSVLESCGRMALYSSLDGDMVLNNGSCVAISKTTILTCKHVSEKDNSKGKFYTVEYGKVKETDEKRIDNLKYSKIVKESDSEKIDYSIIDIKNDKELKPVIMGDSDKLRIGQSIFVISSPKGKPNVITKGIIAGFRTVKGQKVIQITAPIDKGSSGGGLFNSKGELVGILQSANAIDNSIGLAIPINIIKKDAGIK
jgi:S1-C subfamily serine protease